MRISGRAAPYDARMTRVPTVLAAVTTVLAVTFLVVLGFRLFGSTAAPGRTDAAIERTAEEDRIVRVAEAATLAFLDVDYQDMAPKVKKVLDLATGTFYDQYKSAEENLTSAAKQGRATSTGVVKHVGLSKVTATTARAYVAADSTVSNALIVEAQEKGEKVDEKRYYRFQLDLTLVKGQWRVNDLQFVS